ncbi:MAG: hypothetical protein ACXVCY_12080 [Pseudobdellovibrionaceae bacterium]
MDGIISILSLSVIIVAVAIFTNKTRSRHEIPFELEPNCLLTRWPFLFVTGPRSVFYFSSYWNIYTSFLAEHGYEVFTLNLPWNKTKLRRERFKYFLDQQEKLNRHFHLVLDQPTLNEFKDLIQEKKTTVISITQLADIAPPDAVTQLSLFTIPLNILICKSAQQSSFFQPFCYKLHRYLTKSKNLPSLDTLGANPGTAISNSLKLLNRAKAIAEMDLINN